MHRTIIFSLIALVCFSYTYGQADNNYRYVVSAIAVDKDDRPVAFANVAVAPGPGNKGGDFVYSGQADGTGRVRIEIDDSNLARQTRLLYFTGPIPTGAFTPIAPPFSDFAPLTGLNFQGERIKIKKHGEVDLGRLPVRVFYGTAVLSLRDNSGKPLIKDVEGWRAVWLLVRNEKGALLVESSLSIDDISKSVDLAQSSLRVGLPEGTWLIEISPNEDKGPWVSVPALTFSRAGAAKEFTFKF
jgi:hypothetical protein